MERGTLASGSNVKAVEQIVPESSQVEKREKKNVVEVDAQDQHDNAVKNVTGSTQETNKVATAPTENKVQE